MLTKIPLSVVVLMKNSLLAGGIASRLRDDAHLFQMTLLETTERDKMIEQLLDLNPNIIIMDALDVHLLEQLPIIKLLEILPKIKIVQLNGSNDDIHVFTSEEWQARKTDELFSKMLESVVQ